MIENACSCVFYMFSVEREIGEIMNAYGYENSPILRQFVLNLLFFLAVFTTFVEKNVLKVYYYWVVK